MAPRTRLGFAGFSGFAACVAAGWALMMVQPQTAAAAAAKEECGAEQHEEVQHITSKKEPPRFPKPATDQALHLAQQGSLKGLKESVRLYGAGVLAAAADGTTGVIEAALQGDFTRRDGRGRGVRAVRFALETDAGGVMSAGADAGGLCPVFHAVSYRGSAALDAMLSATAAAAPETLAACLSQRDSNGRTVLHLAAQSKATGFSKLFLAASKKTGVPKALAESLDLVATAVPDATYPALTAAVGARDVRLLVEAGADCAATDSLGRTPLHYAASDGYAAAVTVLLEACGAPASDAVAAEAKGWTPAMLAAANGHGEVVARLEGVPGGAAPTPQPLALPEAAAAAESPPPYEEVFGWTDGPDTHVKGYEGEGCGGVRVVACKDLTAADFEANHVLPSRPVLVRGCMGEWPARTAWTPERLKEEHGRLPLSVGAVAYAQTYGQRSRQVPLAAWVDEAQRVAAEGRNEATPFAFDGTVRERARAAGRPTLLDDVGALPAFLADSGVDRDALPSVEFSIAPPLSGANAHFHGEVVTALVAGRKRWTLVVPAEARFSTVTAKDFVDGGGHAASSRTVTCYQAAGDLIYVPRHYGHTVLNLRTSTSIVLTLRV